MALLVSVTTPTSTASSYLKSPKCPLMFLSLSISCALSRSPNHSFSFPIRCHRPFQPLSFSSTAVRPRRCRAASPGPPPPPRTDPPPGNDSRQLKGADLGATLSKIQDRVQIFFAVLFWMSLFFWASAWDGRNRPNKGSRFRR